MHLNSTQSRSAWTEQEDALLRSAVGVYGERSWANVAEMVPGRSSKSCSDRWRNFLSPDVEHPRKSPFTEWEIAVVVLAQAHHLNNWKAISMLLPGRTNRAVKNLFVGNLKWGARLPEVRNRFLECGMTLDQLLEIKPDRAGGPVKLKAGQVLPGAIGDSQDGSPMSGSPASTSSAGSAWQSDMTEHPNISPAMDHVERRRRAAEGDAANAGQASPLPKRRRGVQSPVLGGLLTNHQSPSLMPHPGALGPGSNGSPALGYTLPGSMGPPANRTPSAFTHMDHSCSLHMGGGSNKQPPGSTNGSNDASSSLLLHPGSEATPTSVLAGAEATCQGLSHADGDAHLAAGLSGGCFGAGGAGVAAMAFMQGAHGQGQQGQHMGVSLGHRAVSMPCGGLQGLIMGGSSNSSGSSDTPDMAARVASWHYPGQHMFDGAGTGGLLDTTAGTAGAAAGAAAAGDRTASPFQQHQQQQGGQLSAVGVPGSLTRLLTDSSDGAPLASEELQAAAAAAAAAAAEATVGIKAEAGSATAVAAAAAASFAIPGTEQQQQQYAHWVMQQQQLYPHHVGSSSHQQQPQDPAAAAAGAGADAAAAAAAAAVKQSPSCGTPSSQQDQQQQQGAAAAQDGALMSTAAIVASAAMELQLPGSPVLASNILQDMRSNDSAGLHSMLDQILKEELEGGHTADSSLALLGSSGSLGGASLAPQRSTAFDPPVVSLPAAPEVPEGSGPRSVSGISGSAPSPASNGPHAPPPTPEGGVVAPNLAGSLLGSIQGAFTRGGRGGSLGGSFSQQQQQQQGQYGGHHYHHHQQHRQQQQQGYMQQQGQHHMLSHQQYHHYYHHAQLQQQQQQQQEHYGSSMLSMHAGGLHMSHAEMAAGAHGSSSYSFTHNNQQQQQQRQYHTDPVMELLMHNNQGHLKLEPQQQQQQQEEQEQEALPGGCKSKGASSAAAHTGVSAPTTPAAGASTGAQSAAAAAAGASAAAAAAAVSAGPSSFCGDLDPLMLQLRPVLTRVGGSVGGRLSAGGSMGGMCPPHASAAVAESPAQLINTSFLEDHGLLGGI